MYLKQGVMEGLREWTPETGHSAGRPPSYRHFWQNIYLSNT